MSGVRKGISNVLNTHHIHFYHEILASSDSLFYYLSPTLQVESLHHSFPQIFVICRSKPKHQLTNTKHKIV